MAHFLSPPGPLIGYDIDSKLAPGSVWRMQVPVGQRREIMLSGGQNLTVSSNNPAVVPNDGFGEASSRMDGLRSLTVFGKIPGTSMLEAKLGSATWCSVLVQVGVAPSAAASSDPPSEDGMQIALSPVQLAAVLDGQTVDTNETSNNRLWGGIQVLGGALELVGAAALLLVPEPTMVTKVAGGTLAVHGSDTIATGIVQLVENKPQTTLTAQAAAAAARSMGVDPDDAVKVGMAVDIAIPLVAGFAGAARAVAIRRGAISLASEEAAGGHTIARHVARTEEQLQARLAAQPRIPAASTFRTLAEAEEAVSAALRANATTIRTWASTARAGARMTVNFDAGRTIGFGVVRATGMATDMSKMTVVLEKVNSGNRIFFILTAFPKL